MCIGDELLQREGQIADLVGVIDGWLAKKHKGKEVTFEVFCQEYKKRGGKITEQFAKEFSEQKSPCEVFDYLFDLDIRDWSVLIAYDDSFNAMMGTKRHISIVLHRCVA